MHVFMSSTINLVFGMFVLSINAKKYKKIYIYIYITDASLPRFLENDASASPLPKDVPVSSPLHATLDRINGKVRCDFQGPFKGETQIMALLQKEANPSPRKAYEDT